VAAVASGHAGFAARNIRRPACGARRPGV